MTKGESKAVYFPPFNREFKPLKSLAADPTAKFLTGIGREIAAARAERAAIPAEEALELESRLFEACDGDEHHVVLRLLKEHPHLLVSRDASGATALHHAAKARSGRVFKALLARGAAAWAVDGRGDTPLHVAAREGCADNVAAILPHDPDLNALNEMGNTPMYEAQLGWADLQRKGHGVAEAGEHMRAVHRLMQARADPLLHSPGELSLFLAAVRTRNPMLVKMLLEQGKVDVLAERTPTLGLTALHLALDSGEFQVLMSKFILTRGPSRKLPPSVHNALGHYGLHLPADILQGYNKMYNRTAFDEAINEWSCRLMSLVLDAVPLADRPAFVNVRDDYGMTALHFAAFHGDDHSVKKLAAEGADLHARNVHGQTPIMLAAQRNYVRCAEALVALGARLDDLEDLTFFGEEREDAPAEASEGLCGADPSSLAPESGKGCGGGGERGAGRKKLKRTRVPFHRVPAGPKREYHKPNVGLLEGWNHTSVPEVDMSYCDIERRPNLTAEEFVREYLVPGKPVVIPDAADFWPALRRWSVAYMAERFGGVPYMVMSQVNGRPRTLSMTLPEYLAVLKQQHGSKAPTYLFDGYFEDHSAELMQDVGRTFKGGRRNLELREPFFDVFDYYTYQLVVGPAYAGANPHFHHTTWNVLITGRKRWWIWPPAESFYSTQHPGDW